jgi:cysteine desulfurase family protein (TIGR01976 family)
MVDARQCRAHFPALQSGALHFDNPAGTQIAREALDRMREYLIQSNANHGGAFRTSRASDALVVEARRAAADFLGAERPEEIVFGPNMTSLTLHISRSLASELSQGDEIIVTRLDHDANVSPWMLIARDRGCVVRRLDFDPSDCSWSAKELAGLVNRKTKIVAVSWASNAVGTVNPMAEATRIAREAGAISFVDAVHYAPHGPIDAAELGCDLLACSAYKFFGPHIGILYGRHELLQRLAAYKVRPAADSPPGKWETGTLCFEGIAGVLGAIEYLEWVGEMFGASLKPQFPGLEGRRLSLRTGMEAIRRMEMEYSRRLLDGLSRIDGLAIHGITNASRLDRRVPTFAFTIKGLHPRAVCEALDRMGIYAWDGNYYALEVTSRLGLEDKGGMVRIGAVHYNTEDEIERLVDAVARIAGGKGRA